MRYIDLINKQQNTIISDLEFIKLLKSKSYKSINLNNRLLESINSKIFQNFLNSVTNNAIQPINLIPGNFYAPIGIRTEYSNMTIKTTEVKFEFVKFSTNAGITNFTFKNADSAARIFAGDFLNDQGSIQCLIFNTIGERDHVILLANLLGLDRINVITIV